MKQKMRIISVFAAVSLLFTTGCFLEENSTGPDSGDHGGMLYVLESDFTTGQLAVLNPESGKMTLQDIPVYDDAVLRSYDGYLYILECMGADNVMKIDPSKDGQDAVMYQVKVGDGWNPQDIAFVSNRKAYIANQNEPEITVFDPEKGKVTGHIFIDQYTFRPDSNSTPYANAMAVVNKTLYVALQRRNGFKPGAPTLIVPINVGTGVIQDDDTIACKYKNNYDMIAVDGVLYVSNPGSFDIGDGGIERIDCETRERETVVTEEQLGGNPNQIIYKNGNSFYVQVYIGWQDVRIVEIDVATKEVVKTLSGIDDGWGGICYDADAAKLYVGERGTSGIGIKVYRNNQKTDGPLHTGSSLPPRDLVMVK